MAAAAAADPEGAGARGLQRNLSFTQTAMKSAVRLLYDHNETT